MSRTATYATTNIVILGDEIYAEDFSHETGKFEVPPRVAAFLDVAHVRKWGPFEGKHAMHGFTLWLWQDGIVVDKCRVLEAELSDEERRA